jgi:DNA polymerase-3 subunit delta
MRINESALKDSLKLNKLCNLYYFFGKEDFLVKTYTERVRERFAPDLDEFNFVKFNGTFDCDSLEEAIETLPVFADKKVVQIHDFDAEKTDADSLEKIIGLLADIPEYCAVIISITGFEPGKNAKTKKLISAVEKHGAVCEFVPLSKAKAADLIMKKAARSGCRINRYDAEYLHDLTLGSLTLIGTEVDKLCAYIGTGGEITKEIIDRLTPRLTETKVFELSKALTSKNAKTAFHIFDDLMAQNESFDGLLAYLSKIFISNYHTKIGNKFGARAGEIAYARKCISLLYNANIKLRTHDKRIVFEKTMTEILML